MDPGGPGRHLQEEVHARPLGWSASRSLCRGFCFEIGASRPAQSRVEDLVGFANLGTCDRLVGQVCRKKKQGGLYERWGWPS